jgi:hypothetical protein
VGVAEGDLLVVVEITDRLLLRELRLQLIFGASFAASSGKP